VILRIPTGPIVFDSKTIYLDVIVGKSLRRRNTWPRPVSELFSSADLARQST